MSSAKKVDLSSPARSQYTMDDSTVASCFDNLQFVLDQLNLPPTVDRSSTPVKHAPVSGVTVAIVSTSLDVIWIIAEEGRLHPNEILLVMSPTWLDKKKKQESDEHFSLFALKGITIDDSGKTYIDVFDPPRQVTYLVDLLQSVNEGDKINIETLETNLDCPTSSSASLSRLIDNKLWTRLCMQESEIAFPLTLAFAYRPTVHHKSESMKCVIVELEKKTGVEDLITEHLTTFINTLDIQEHEMVVVKRSGTLTIRESRISSHLRTNVAGITSAIMAILKDLDPDGVVLVEAFYDMTMTNNAEATTVEMKGAATDNHGCSIRAIVCRGADGRPHVTSITCGIGLKEDLVSCYYTLPQALETALCAFGIIEKSRHLEIEKYVQKSCRQLFNVMDAHEKKLGTKERGNALAQTDLMAVTFVLSTISDEVNVVALDVDNHYFITNCQMHNLVYLECCKGAFRPFIQNAIVRSQQFLLRGKRFLVVGAGGYEKKFIWNAAEAAGIEIYLVESNFEHFARQYISEFLIYDFTDHSQDLVHASNIILLLEEKDVFSFDGCITFLDDCVPLVAHICEQRGMNGASVKGATAIKKKSELHRILSTNSGAKPFGAYTKLYTLDAFHIENREDIRDIAAQLSFPCVVMPDYGCGEAGSKIVTDVSQCYNELEVTLDEFEEHKTNANLGLGHGKGLVIMEYIEGSHHNVSIVLFRQKLVTGIVTDKGSTMIPYLNETTATLPSYLHKDRQRQLIIAAFQCAIDVGLVSGVFDADFRLTAVGPKLTQIHSRTNSYYLRNWIQQVYSIDFLMYAFLVACNIRPYVPDLKPRGQIMGAMVLPSEHSEIIQSQGFVKLLKVLEDNDVVRVNRFAKKAPTATQPPKYEEAYSNIALLDRNRDTVRSKVLGIISLLGLNIGKYQVKEFLKDFQLI